MKNVPSSVWAVLSVMYFLILVVLLWEMVSSTVDGYMIASGQFPGYGERFFNSIFDNVSKDVMAGYMVQSLFGFNWFPALLYVALFICWHEYRRHGKMYLEHRAKGV